LIISILLFAAVVVVYSGVWQCGFIDYDDNTHVFANVHVRAGLSMENIKWAFTSIETSQWIPLTWISYMCDISVFGFDPGVMHLTNVAFHAANAVLLFWVLWRMTGAMWQSTLVAAIFALHPVNVESVAWIAERKNVLSTFFWLLSIWFYVSYAKDRRIKWMALAAVCMALGLMSKAMLVTLPFTLLLFDVWPLRRQESWGRLVLEKAPLFLLTVVGSIIQLEAGRRTNLLTGFESAPFDYRVCGAAANYLWYAWQLLWPAKLSLIYPSPSGIQVLATGISVALFGAIVWAGWRYRARAPFILVGVFWYFGTMIPVGGLFRAGDVIFADRYSYIPQIGLLIAVVWSLGLLASEKIKPVLATLSVVILGTLSWLTIRYVSYWVDGEVLFTHCAKIHPESWKLNTNAGVSLYRNEKFEEAISYYEAALRVMPNSDSVNVLMGEAYSRLGNNDEAIVYFKKAAQLNPESINALFNLATHLQEKGETKIALNLFRKILEREPRNAEVHFRAGRILELEGDITTAQEHYRKGLQSVKQP